MRLSSKMILSPKSRVRPSLLVSAACLTLLLTAAAARPQGERLRIVSLEPWFPGIEPAYLKVDVEYPMDFERPTASLSVNGRKAAFKSLSGGFGGGWNFSSYAIAAGEPGRKTVTVTLKAGGRTLTASRTVDFRSRGGAVFLDLSNGEAVWQPPQVKVFVYFLKNLALEVNGRPAALHQASAPEFPGHAVLTVAADWRPGLNHLVVTGTDHQGQAISQKLAFYWVKDGVARQGDAFSVFLGYMGSKSGPFYYPKVTGSALALGESKWGEVFLLDKDGWLGKATKLLQEVKAQAPGPEVITILVKKHFLGGVEVDRKLNLQVLP